MSRGMKHPYRNHLTFLQAINEQARMELAEAFGQAWPGQNAIAKGIEAVAPSLRESEQKQQQEKNHEIDFTP